MILKIFSNSIIPIFALFMLVGCRYESEKLNTEIESLDVKISNLPTPQIASPFWTLGCKSTGSAFADEPLEILIHLPESRKLDAVVLMPALHKVGDSYHTYVFPKKFLIELLHPDGSKTRIADYSQIEYPEPELSPQWFPSASTKKTTTIRIYATELRQDPTWEDRGYIMALSECYAFSGVENVILNAHVEFKGEYQMYMKWHHLYLVDGYTYYSPLRQHVDNPNPNFNAYAPDGRLDLYIDLGEARNITELHFWPLAFCPHEGHALLNTIGFPRYIHVRIANKPDYSDAVDLYKTDILLQAPGVGPLMRRVEPHLGRYIWLTLGESLTDVRGPLNKITLAEIMCLSQGHPVTFDAQVSWASDVEVREDFIPNRLVNGHTPQGQILNLREWLEQLHLRNQLLKKRADIVGQLDDLNQRNAQVLRILSHVVPFGVFVLLGIAMLARQREKWRIQKMRDQIACDLHDEVGANLSGIKGTAELLKEISGFEHPKQVELINDVIENSQQTATEIRMLIRFLKRGKFPGELLSGMQKTASKMLGDISYQFDVEGEIDLEQLSANKKWDIFFFFKEAIHNIVKHSNAENVFISLKKKDDAIELFIQDNGVGVQKLDDQTFLHLKNRASKIKGDMIVHSKIGSGTQIVLSLKNV